MSTECKSSHDRQGDPVLTITVTGWHDIYRLKTAIDTREEFDDWSREADDDSVFLVDATGEPWIAFRAEDGDWYATRPPGEDDHESLAGKGVTSEVEALTFPIIVQLVPSWAEEAKTDE